MNNSLMLIVSGSQQIPSVQVWWCRLTIGLLLATYSPIQAQPLFTNVEAGLPGVDFNSVAVWGDYDGDGMLDILLAGEVAMRQVSGIWRNTGNGFSGQNADFPASSRHPISFGDYDNDNRWDIASAGIYRNTGTNFVIISGTGISNGNADWGDYDNDGRPDIIASGSVSGPFITRVTWIMRNTGSGFEIMNFNLPGVERSCVAWGDYNKDGLLDFAVSGSTGTTGISQIWSNNGTGFVKAGFALPGMVGAAVAWADYDNDGWPDLLLSGDPGSGPVTQIWRNAGTNFINTGVSLPGASVRAVAWGDYDNDGRLDLLLNNELWRNTENGFVKVDAGLPTLSVGSCAWGDYDGDGRLDILITGRSSTLGNASQVWRNSSNVPSNNPPSSPTGLSVTVQERAARLSWNAALDLETPTPGLTYNVRVGTRPGGTDILSPMSDPSTGRRPIVKRGNAETRLWSLLKNLPVGTYYWSVQTIDSGFAGSPFAPEQAFIIRNPKPAITNFARFPNGSFQIQGNGVAGSNYFLEVSVDLQTWTNLVPLKATSTGRLEYTDPTAADFPKRFYTLGEP